MIVHLIDGTYELFRHYYAVPPSIGEDGIDIGAVRGVCASVLSMLERGTTHVGVATDHVIESFRNGLWPGYKTGEGMDPVLWAQFPVLEDALRAMGVVVWAMVEFEADDALAAAAADAARDDRVEQVVICTPDKDLSQCVVGTRVVQLDRRRNEVRDEDGVHAKFGVGPAQIADYLALVGDAADGFPGLPGFGAKTAAAVLRRYGTIEKIPDEVWDVPGVRGIGTLANTLREHREHALLFKTLATLREDAVAVEVDHLRWAGPTAEWPRWAARLGDASLGDRAAQVASRT